MQRVKLLNDKNNSIVKLQKKDKKALKNGDDRTFRIVKMRENHYNESIENNNKELEELYSKIYKQYIHNLDLNKFTFGYLFNYISYLSKSEKGRIYLKEFNLFYEDNKLIATKEFIIKYFDDIEKYIENKKIFLYINGKKEEFIGKLIVFNSTISYALLLSDNGAFLCSRNKENWNINKKIDPTEINLIKI